MAFRSNGPVTLALPPFRGVTRQIIVAALLSFFGFALLALVLPQLAGTVLVRLFLVPTLLAKGMLWQLVTYPFVGNGLLGLLFGCLSVWFFGSTLEDERGSRWLAEYFLAATAGGGFLAAVLSFALRDRMPGLGATSVACSLWPAVLALLVAFAFFNPEQELVFSFVLRLKAKYLLAIYVLIYAARAIVEGDRMSAVTALCNALVGYGFLRFAPRAGLQRGLSEQWFGLRNRWYRAKRQRAARKFTVYMRKQGKDVNIDPTGKYVSLEDEKQSPKDSRWMN